MAVTAAARLRLRLGVAVQILLVLALVAGTNALVARNPVPGLRGDWTEDSRHTLHPDTAALLEGVKDPVELVLFHTPLAGRHPDREAFDAEVFVKTDLLLREAGYRSRRITTETIHPATNPDRAQAALARTGLEDSAMGGNFLLVHARGRNIQIGFSQLGSLDPATGQIRYHGEDVLYKAVAEVTRREVRMVTFLEGHGELDPTEADDGLALATLLNREAYRIGRVDLARGQTIPPETSVLVVARPLQELGREAIAALDDYHRRGGNLLLLIGARTPAANLRHYLETQFKLALRDEHEMLHDPKGTLPRYPEWIVAERNFNADHPITRPLARAEQKLTVVLPRVRPLTLTAPGVCTSLLASNPGSWPDRYRPGYYARQLEEDEKVPGYELQGFPMAVAVDPRLPSQRLSGDQAGRVVLFCSGEFASSQFVNTFPANGALLVNAVHWLSGKDAGERIAPVAIRQVRLAMTDPDRRLLFWAVVVLPAAVMLLLGVLVFWLRRG
ncbi:MAG: GldG family protein [Planctomycetes bacterium]|nr:GldG family protein [Planctomycetota bacterium]